MKTWASLKDALARQVSAVSLLGKIVPAADRISAEIPSYLLIEGRPPSLATLGMGGPELSCLSFGLARSQYPASRISRGGWEKGFRVLCQMSRTDTLTSGCSVS